MNKKKIISQVIEEIRAPESVKLDTGAYTLIIKAKKAIRSISDSSIEKKRYSLFVVNDVVMKNTTVDSLSAVVMGRFNSYSESGEPIYKDDKVLYFPGVELQAGFRKVRGRVAYNSIPVIYVENLNQEEEVFVRNEYGYRGDTSFQVCFEHYNDAMPVKTEMHSQGSTYMLEAGNQLGKSKVYDVSEDVRTCFGGLVLITGNSDVRNGSIKDDNLNKMFLSIYKSMLVMQMEKKDSLAELNIRVNLDSFSSYFGTLLDVVGITMLAANKAGGIGKVTFHTESIETAILLDSKMKDFITGKKNSLKDWMSRRKIKDCFAIIKIMGDLDHSPDMKVLADIPKVGSRMITLPTQGIVLVKTKRKQTQGEAIRVTEANMGVEVIKARFISKELEAATGSGLGTPVTHQGHGGVTVEKLGVPSTGATCEVVADTVKCDVVLKKDHEVALLPRRALEKCRINRERYWESDMFTVDVKIAGRLTELETRFITSSNVYRATTGLEVTTQPLHATYFIDESTDTYILQLGNRVSNMDTFKDAAPYGKRTRNKGLAGVLLMTGTDGSRHKAPVADSHSHQLFRYFYKAMLLARKESVDKSVDIRVDFSSFNRGISSKARIVEIAAIAAFKAGVRKLSFHTRNDLQCEPLVRIVSNNFISLSGCMVGDVKGLRGPRKKVVIARRKSCYLILDELSNLQHRPESAAIPINPGKPAVIIARQQYEDGGSILRLANAGVEVIVKESPDSIAGGEEVSEVDVDSVSVQVEVSVGQKEKLSYFEQPVLISKNHLSRLRGADREPAFRSLTGISSLERSNLDVQSFFRAQEVAFEVVADFSELSGIGDVERLSCVSVGLDLTKVDVVVGKAEWVTISPAVIQRVIYSPSDVVHLVAELFLRAFLTNKYQAAEQRTGVVLDLDSVPDTLEGSKTKIEVAMIAYFLAMKIGIDRVVLVTKDESVLAKMDVMQFCVDSLASPASSGLFEITSFNDFMKAVYSMDVLNTEACPKGPVEVKKMISERRGELLLLETFKRYLRLNDGLKKVGIFRRSGEKVIEARLLQEFGILGKVKNFHSVACAYKALLKRIIGLKGQRAGGLEMFLEVSTDYSQINISPVEDDRDVDSLVEDDGIDDGEERDGDVVFIADPGADNFKASFAERVTSAVFKTTWAPMFVKLLEKDTFRVFRREMVFMNEVSRYSRHSQMGARNLALIVGKSIFDFDAQKKAMDIVAEKKIDLSVERLKKLGEIIRYLNDVSADITQYFIEHPDILSQE